VNLLLTKKIELIAAPEGNSNAVGEHSLGMLLSLFNKLNKADKEVRARNVVARRKSRSRTRWKNNRH